jgi:hypothetical protein
MTGKMHAFRIYRLLISHFLKKKSGKMPFFVFIDPYRTRPGTGETCSLHVTPPVEITPKIPAKFASLNSSFAFGDLRLGGCLRTPRPQAPARAQSPTRNTRIKRRKFRRGFVGYFDIPESEVYTSEFTVRAHILYTLFYFLHLLLYCVHFTLYMHDYMN